MRNQPTERVAWVIALLLIPCSWSHGISAQESPVIPFSDIPSTQWLEVVDGDPSVAGEPYVLRLHNDAGYVVLPHTHAEIEHIVVVSGSWSLALGSRYDSDALEPMEVGDHAKVPAVTPHYGRAVTEMTIQVHGIGPFNTDYFEAVYHLNSEGIFVEDRAGTLGENVTNRMSYCFEFRVGDRVEGAAGSGTVVEGQCSPVNDFTQYWIQPEAGDRFWATPDQLSRVP